MKSNDMTAVALINDTERKEVWPEAVSLHPSLEQSKISRRLAAETVVQLYNSFIFMSLFVFLHEFFKQLILPLTLFSSNHSPTQRPCWHAFRAAAADSEKDRGL
ncbi:Hypothetical predicted protein [Xyrichtys novacula]|uniref:Uncharacterized protein n=1 Tax=Xyrichtys novacula TaxID=13765 RepID=A0AAV1FE74_XYRNO|nr:Hypothetical predicted protein [Xyrichtys novacula]